MIFMCFPLSVLLIFFAKLLGCVNVLLIELIVFLSISFSGCFPKMAFTLSCIIPFTNPLQSWKLSSCLSDFSFFLACIDDHPLPSSYVPHVLGYSPLVSSSPIAESIFAFASLCSFFIASVFSDALLSWLHSPTMPPLLFP